jgi:hypothetical protein
VADVGNPGTEVLIRAGVPGKPTLKVDYGRPYPNTTTDMAKLIAERGFTVAFEDERDQRSYVSFYAAELWVPILQVTSTVLAAAGANLLSALILDLIGSTERTDDKVKDTILHVEYTVVDSKGNARNFKGSGAAPDVLDAIDAFERKAIDGK